METVRRKIQAKKFYTTLPHKINSAVEDFKRSTPEPDPEMDWKFEEVGSSARTAGQSPTLISQKKTTNNRQSHIHPPRIHNQ